MPLCVFFCFFFNDELPVPLFCIFLIIKILSSMFLLKIKKLIKHYTVTLNMISQDGSGRLSLLGMIDQCLKAGKKQSWHAASVTNICVGLLAGLKVLTFPLSYA